MIGLKIMQPNEAAPSGEVRQPNRAELIIRDRIGGRDDLLGRAKVMGSVSPASTTGFRAGCIGREDYALSYEIVVYIRADGFDDAAALEAGRERGFTRTDFVMPAATHDLGVVHANAGETNDQFACLGCWVGLGCYLELVDPTEFVNGDDFHASIV